MEEVGAPAAKKLNQSGGDHDEDTQPVTSSIRGNYTSFCCYCSCNLHSYFSFSSSVHSVILTELSSVSNTELIREGSNTMSMQSNFCARFQIWQRFQISNQVVCQDSGKFPGITCIAVS